MLGGGLWQSGLLEQRSASVCTRDLNWPCFVGGGSCVGGPTGLAHAVAFLGPAMGSQRWGWCVFGTASPLDDAGWILRSRCNRHFAGHRSLHASLLFVWLAMGGDP